MVVISPVMFPFCQFNAAGKRPFTSPVDFTIKVNDRGVELGLSDDEWAGITPKQPVRTPIADIR
jgi:hypothetical protein